MVGASTESMFLAGAAGYLASVLMSLSSSRKASIAQAELLRTMLFMLLGGYVAAFVLQLGSTGYAFMAGLALDKGLAVMQSAAVRLFFGHNRMTGKPQVGGNLRSERAEQ